MSALLTPPEIVYPESDGQPMAENMTQARAITVAHGGIDGLLAGNPNAFAAMDNFIYPVEGRPEIVTAPDVYVAFGRPKGDRGSYRVWEEGGIFPQVIFEVLSPGNTKKEMAKKLAFYDEHGAEEYYVYDPDRVTLDVYLRQGGGLVKQPQGHGFVSPRLGIRFDLSGTEWAIFAPDGTRFETPAELYRQTAAEKQRADAERRRADAAKRRADAAEKKIDAERFRAETAVQGATAEKARADRLAEKLRALGLDPDA